MAGFVGVLEPGSEDKTALPHNLMFLTKGIGPHEVYLWGTEHKIQVHLADVQAQGQEFLIAFSPGIADPIGVGAAEGKVACGVLIQQDVSKDTAGLIYRREAVD
jgi:hypothetical protein